MLQRRRLPRGQETRNYGLRDRRKGTWNESTFLDFQKGSKDINGAVSMKGRKVFNEICRYSGANNSLTHGSDIYKHDIIILSDSDDSDATSNSELDLLEDVEDALVATALARIWRAKEKGKKDVNLSKAELAALAKRRQLRHAAANSDGTKKRRSVAVPLSSPIISDQHEPFYQSEKYCEDKGEIVEKLLEVDEEPDWDLGTTTWRPSQTRKFKEW